MFKGVLAFVCALCLLCGSVVSSYACYYSNGSMSQEELDRDVSYWRQGKVPADNSLIHSGTDRTIGRAACSHFAMSYALVKMGYMNPETGGNPIDHIELARQHHAFRVNWGYYEYAKAPAMYPGVTYHGVDNNVNGLVGEAGLDYVRGKMSEGYYVIACVRANYAPGCTPEGKNNTITGGHMIFFDGINEDGTVSVGDSALYGTTWEEFYGTKEVVTTWGYLELLKCDGKPFSDQPSIYDGNALRGVNDDEIIKYNNVLAEYDLTGMPEMSNLAQYAILPEYTDLESLMPHELLSLSAIQNAKESKELSASAILNATAIFIGVLLILYSISLILGFAFDCVNVFIDIEIIKILTFGYITVIRDKDDLKHNKKKGYISVAKLLAIIIVVAFIGISLISGTAVAFLYRFVGGLYPS